MNHLLSWIIWLPVLGMVAIAFIPRDKTELIKQISAATVASVLLSARPVDVTEQAAINNKTEMQRLVVTAAFISLHDWIDSVDRTESDHHRCAMKA